VVRQRTCRRSILRDSASPPEPPVHQPVSLPGCRSFSCHSCISWLSARVPCPIASRFVYCEYFVVNRIASYPCFIGVSSVAQEPLAGSPSMRSRLHAANARTVPFQKSLGKTNRSRPLPTLRRTANRAHLRMRWGNAHNNNRPPSDPRVIDRAKINHCPRKTKPSPRPAPAQSKIQNSLPPYSSRSAVRAPVHLTPQHRIAPSANAPQSCTIQNLKSKIQNSFLPLPILNQKSKPLKKPVAFTLNLKKPRISPKNAKQFTV
jgi:hypothetical protein